MTTRTVLEQIMEADPRPLYWRDGELNGNVLGKARRMIDLGLIRMMTDSEGHHFAVSPLPGCKTINRVAARLDSCSCQGFKKNGDCSHILATRGELSLPGRERWLSLSDLLIRGGD